MALILNSHPIFAINDANGIAPEIFSVDFAFGILLKKNEIDLNKIDSEIEALIQKMGEIELIFGSRITLNSPINIT